MSTVRTLPIRVTPMDGEALDSWLEALAHRTHTAFGDLLSAVGLSPYHGMGTSAWIVRLTPDERAVIAAATGITHETLETMTLDHYSGSAVRINNDARTLSRAFPWGRTRGSRFCPTCLEKTGGRWQLAWRLGWTFACTEHHCLLADACPHCGAVQRRRTHIGDLIPTAGRCAHPAASAIGRSPARCDTELTAAPVTVFDADHPAIHAQRIINAVIADETATFGVYRTRPQSRINVLADIRAVAGRALAYATPQDLDAVIPPDLHAAYREASLHENVRSGPARVNAKPGLAAPARAATAAVGVVTALTVLGRPDVESAGDALRWLVTSSRERGSTIYPTNIAWGKSTSAVLTGVQLAALGPSLHPSDQLRYRIGTPLPLKPAPGAARSTLARRLPSMLWSTWSLRMSIPNCHQWQLRPALSNILLLVHSRLTLDEAAGLIDSPLDGPAVSRVLQLLEQEDQWLDIRTALVRMVDYLADSDVPIDYQRRRHLDYSTLLPDMVWARICRDTATSGPRSVRARIARCFLFERLSGQPAGASPWAMGDSAFRTKTANFPRHLTAQLAQSLDEHAHAFLADQGINDEPVTWHPPNGVLHGLDLPGEDQRMSLKNIAETVGVSRQIIARLAHDYDVPLRKPARAARMTIDRDWLYDQYINKRRALPDIAQEAGMSTANMARWAQTHAIPMRGRGGCSHSATLQAESVAATAPELLRPALAGIGGRERLERFAAAARHPTLTVAAEALGVHQFTLVNQIRRVERELGTTLLIRAERGHPMQLTDDGARVVATVRACRRKVWR